MQKRWNFPEKLTKEQIQNKIRIANEFKCPELIAEILIRKGLTTNQEIKQFFSPELEQMHDPFIFEGMKTAVDRVLKAIENREKITIFGDYDVDGTTSTSILYLGFLRLNAIVDYYIPHRIDDGFGLPDEIIDDFKLDGTNLIITVDFGINSVEETRKINEAGMDIIITDHHNPKEELPNAVAIINPKIEDCNYPNKHLAGVGVAFKLLMAVYKAKGMYTKPNVERFMELVALGTIADIVPLVDENRIFAKFGLQKLGVRKNIGLNALTEITGLTNKEINTTDIIFGIAPRINAAGRMGSAMRSVELMTECDHKNARELAEIIERENSIRQQIDQKTYQEACEIIEKKYPNIDKTQCIVISSNNWHPGVIGIVASKIVEKYYRPTIMISCNNGNVVGVGSGRSIEGFDLFQALSSVDSLLESFGGHKYATGLSINMLNIDKFENKFSKYVREHIDPEDLFPPLKLEYEIELYDITFSLLDWLDKFAPYGPGNSRPLFFTKNVMVDGYPYTVGRNHLKMRVMKDGCELDLIGFNLGHLLPKLKKNSYIDIAYSIELNTWQEKRTIQGKVSDIRFHK